MCSIDRVSLKNISHEIFTNHPEALLVEMKIQHHERRLKDFDAQTQRWQQIITFHRLNCRTWESLHPNSHMSTNRKRNEKKAMMNRKKEYFVRKINHGIQKYTFSRASQLALWNINNLNGNLILSSGEGRKISEETLWSLHIFGHVYGFLTCDVSIQSQIKRHGNPVVIN